MTYYLTGKGQAKTFAKNLQPLSNGWRTALVRTDRVDEYLNLDPKQFSNQKIVIVVSQYFAHTSKVMLDN